MTENICGVYAISERLKGELTSIRGKPLTRKESPLIAQYYWYCLLYSEMQRELLEVPPGQVRALFQDYYVFLTDGRHENACHLEPRLFEDSKVVRTKRHHFAKSVISAEDLADEIRERFCRGAAFLSVDLWRKNLRLVLYDRKVTDTGKTFLTNHRLRSLSSDRVRKDPQTLARSVVFIFDFPSALAKAVRHVQSRAKLSEVEGVSTMFDEYLAVDDNRACFLRRDAAAVALFHPKLCFLCGKRPKKRCSRCHITWYCGEECSELHWSAHRTFCRRGGVSAADESVPLVVPSGTRLAFE